MTYVSSPAAPVLAVDLDGTLLQSDMLHESFWSAMGRNWQSPFRAAAALVDGKAALKRLLAETSNVNVATLPYDAEVIAAVEAWRAEGGRTVLVTASDMRFAEAVGAHLGIFDEVHGSDATQNLKGPAKAAFLEARFGPKGFVYMGDAPADVAVWARAAKAITVNASPALRKAAEDAAGAAEHLTTQNRSTKAYIKALRPHQWLKNVLVFLPLMAAHQFDADGLLRAGLAFVCFSLVASSVYVLNDLLDLDADRAHPRKRERPFASGAVPIAHGTALAGGLLALGALVAVALGGLFLAVMVGYYLLTTAYSLVLKRQVVIDICVLTGLYTTRIVAGGAATGIELSVWLLAFSVFFFLALAAVKRQAELVDGAERGQLKASGRGYTVDDLPVMTMIAVSAGYVAILVLMLYVNAPNVVELYGRPEALWGVCAVLLYWVTRAIMIAHRGHMHDDPVVFAAKDRVSQLCLGVILVFVVGGALA